MCDSNELFSLITRNTQAYRRKDRMSLHLIVGPMFAGKSTELIRRFRMHRFMGQRILVVNHVWNQRYNSSQVTTHDLLQIEHDLLHTTDRLASILTYPGLEGIDTIFIEELQFFEDAYDVVTHLVDTCGKQVIASGLDGSAEREPMGDVLRLVPHADTVNRVVALCQVCRDGTPGIFSSRLVSDTTAVVDVGAADKYEALCRRHFLTRHPELRK